MGQFNLTPPCEAVSEDTGCPFCKRPVIRLTIHHLVPKALGGRKTIRLCRDCHKAIHSLISNRMLKNQYHTVEALLGHEGLRKMIAFIAKQDPNRKLPMKRAKNRGGSRYN